MLRLKHAAPFSIVIAVLSGQTAHASTIAESWTIQTLALALDDFEAEDAIAPVSTISASALRLNGGDVVTASARQDADGFSSIEVNVQCAFIDAFACSGGYDDGKTPSTAKAVRTLKLKNAGTTATDTGIFDFRISGVELDVFDGGGGRYPFLPEATVEFFALATVGDVVVDQYSAAMTLTGTSSDFRTEGVRNFTGTVENRDCYLTLCNRGFIAVDPLVASLDLGVLEPGEVAEILTDLTVKIKFPGFEVGARAKALDPSGLSYYSYSFGSAPTPTPVPLPAAGWMLLAGLASVFAMRRRTRR